MSDDRDWSWLHHPKAAAPTYAEQRLWTLCKLDHRAECLVRQHPLGPEVRVNVDGRFLWSQVVRSGEWREVSAIADEHRHAFEARGWVPTDPGH